MINIVEPSVELMHDEDVLKKLELCSRVCYKSEDKICEGSAEKLLTHIIKREHLSCLEHVHLTLSSSDKTDRDLQYVKDSMKTTKYFKDSLGQYNQVKYLYLSNNDTVTGNVRAWVNFFRTHTDNYHANRLLNVFNDKYPILFQELHIPECVKSPTLSVNPSDDYLTIKFTCNLGISHELVRSRVLSFSQTSTRYCVYKDSLTFIKPCYDWAEEIQVGLNQQRPPAHKFNNASANIWYEQMHDVTKTYLALLDHDLPPQEARDVLPKSLMTEVVCTGTTNEILGLMNLRSAKAAHPEVRKLMELIIIEVNKLYPNVEGVSDDT